MLWSIVSFSVSELLTAVVASRPAVYTIIGSPGFSYAAPSA